MSSFSERACNIDEKQPDPKGGSWLQINDTNSPKCRERINATVESLLKNNGPTDSGLAVKGYRLSLEELKIALEEAGQRGLSPAWRTIHFNDIWGKDHDPEIVKELVLKKIQFLRDKKYGGDLFDLITKGHAQEFLTNFEEVVEGRKVSITFSEFASDNFHNSPFRIIEAYLKVTDDAERVRFADIQPWHFLSLPKGFLKEAQYRDALLGLKIDQLLGSEKYNGQFYKLVGDVGYNDLTSPYISSLDGRPVTVSMNEMMESVGNAPFKALSVYLKYKHSRGELLNAKFLPPYYLKKMSAQSNSDESILAEVYVRMIQERIKATGSIDDAFKGLKSTQLRAGYTVMEGDVPIHIATKTTAKTLGIKISNAREKFDELKPTIKPNRWRFPIPRKQLGS